MSPLLQWPLRQWQLFCLALAFFSRIPVPASTPYSPELLNQSSRYLSLVGLLLGALQALVSACTSSTAALSIAVLLSLMAGLVLTGAFHEDGLADTADGLGGGLSLECKLEIMKDSRVRHLWSGHAVLCVFNQMAKPGQALDTQAVWALVLVAGLSRATAVSLTFVLPYQQLDVVSKSKPIATSLQKRALTVDLAFCSTTFIFCALAFSFVFTCNISFVALACCIFITAASCKAIPVIY